MFNIFSYSLLFIITVIYQFIIVTFLFNRLNTDSLLYISKLCFNNFIWDILFTDLTDLLHLLIHIYFLYCSTRVTYKYLFLDLLVPSI